MNLKNIRKELGLSLRQVAKATGISHNTVLRAENDSVDVGYRKVSAIKAFYDAELAKLNREESKEND